MQTFLGQAYHHNYNCEDDNKVDYKDDHKDAQGKTKKITTKTGTKTITKTTTKTNVFSSSSSGFQFISIRYLVSVLLSQQFKS